MKVTIKLYHEYDEVGGEYMRDEDLEMVFDVEHEGENVLFVLEDTDGVFWAKRQDLIDLAKLLKGDEQNG